MDHLNAPPTGSTADENRGPELVAVVATFLTFAWLTVGLRFYVRLRIVKSFLLDDWLTLATLFFFTTYCALCFVAVFWGGGRHALDLTLHHNINALRIWWCCELFYILSTTFVRLAAAAFLFRFARRTWHRAVLHSCNIINITFNLYFLISCFLQCRPLNYFWQRIDFFSEGICYNIWGILNTYIQIGLMAAIDYTLGLLPMFILWDLNIDKKRKILICAILSIVCLASTATVIRIPYVYSLAQSGDFLWYTVDLSIWSSIEPALGLMALCLVTLGPLLRTYLNSRAKPSRSTFGTSNIKSNLRRQHWSPDDTELALRGLPVHLGNTSIIEGGLKSQRSGISSKAWGVHFDEHRRGSKTTKVSLKKDICQDRFVITKTTDIETWSDGDDVEAKDTVRKDDFS